jgi:hypothetical protein
MPKYEVIVKECQIYGDIIEADSKSEAIVKMYEQLDCSVEEKKQYFHDCDDESEAFEIEDYE